MKDFVPYEQSLELKELGFDEPCFANYTVIPEDKIDWFTIPEQGITDKTSFGSSKNYNSKSFEEEGTISAPTYSQAFKWFREKHKIHSFIDCKWKNIGWEYELVDLNKMEKISCIGNYGYKTPEEAELECLKKLIEIAQHEK